MELRQLEYFCRIADTGSIHEAARRLNLSQPPLSYQLRQLEEELGVDLEMEEKVSTIGELVDFVESKID